MTRTPSLNCYGSSFRTLVLLPFRLCLDHSFKELSQNLSLSFQHRSPSFCECKDTTFLFHPTLFLKNFQLFLSCLICIWFTWCYNRKFSRFIWKLVVFYDFFRLFGSPFTHLLRRKYHKIPKTDEKPLCFDDGFLGRDVGDGVRGTGDRVRGTGCGGRELLLNTPY